MRGCEDTYERPQTRVRGRKQMSPRRKPGPTVSSEPTVQSELRRAGTAVSRTVPVALETVVVRGIRSRSA